MPDNLKQYLPRIYDNVLETDLLMEAQDGLFNDYIRPETTSVRQNQYILSADENGIKSFEDIVGIVANPATEKLEFRRQRLLNRWSMRSPFTMRFLKSKLDNIIGAGKYTITMDYPTYTLSIESAAIDQAWYEEIYFTINSIKPANIVFINKPLAASAVKISEEISGVAIEWNYRTGTSAAISNTKPLADYKDLGVFKLPEVHSVETQMLNNNAAFAAGDIASVLINNTHSITNFATKTAVGNIATVEYVVSIGDIVESAITNIKFRDAQDRTLTNAAVYVPLIEDVTMKHKITMKEGA